MAEKLCGVSFQGKDKNIYFLVFFQSMNLFKMPLLEVPALGGLRWGAGWQGFAWGRCSCPGSGFLAVGFRGVACLLFLFKTKP